MQLYCGMCQYIIPVIEVARAAVVDPVVVLEGEDARLPGSGRAALCPADALRRRTRTCTRFFEKRWLGQTI
jgi:hypothetical protein